MAQRINLYCDSGVICLEIIRINQFVCLIILTAVIAPDGTAQADTSLPEYGTLYLLCLLNPGLAECGFSGFV